MKNEHRWNRTASIRRPAVRRIVARLVTAATLATAGLATGASVVPSSVSAALPNATGVIVGLNPGESIAAVNAAHATTTLRSIDSMQAHLVTWTDARTVDAVIAELLTDPRVAYADPNRTVRAPEVAFSGRIYKWTSVPPAAAGTQWASTLLQLSQVHQSTTGAGITVAVIDTGVDATHPTLAGVVTPGRDFVDGDAIATDSANGVDENLNGVVDEAAGHGTHVAGIVHMIAPAAKIMPVRALDSDGNADTFRVAEGMIWAADHGAQVLNLSLGQPDLSTLLKQTAERLWARGASSSGRRATKPRVGIVPRCSEVRNQCHGHHLH